MKSKNRLFVTLHSDTTIKKKYGFRFTEARLHKMKNGWYRASVDWTANADKAYLFKYCYEDGKLFEYDASSVHLRFSMLPKTFKTSMDIGLQMLTNKRTKHTPVHVQNTKYGVLVYFAPHSFETDNGTCIEEYNFDENGELVN